MSDKKSRLLWRCRRGIKEMDIIFQDFINHSYDQLTDDEKNAFSRLLDEQDLDILNWIMGKDKPYDNELVNIINTIRESRNIN
jgi:antitoxin CptB